MTTELRRHIMFVDDDEFIGELMEEFLTDSGHVVSRYSDPAAAFADFVDDCKRFDVLITDESMPGMGGSELAAKIREIRPDLPIVLCTGTALSVEPKNQGAVSVILQKPVGLQSLLETIERLQ